jgi:ABC-type sugar transport system permease subunit
MSEQLSEKSNEEKKSFNEALNQEKSGKKNRALQVILGIIFILPAIAALIFTQVIPTVRTIKYSFRDVTFLKDAGPVGMENYQRMFDHSAFGQATTLTLLMTLIRILIVLFPPLFLALGTSALKTELRKAVRVFVTIPWAVYSPISLGITWLLISNPIFGFGSKVFNLANPNFSRWITLLMDGLSFLGLACGLGLTVYLATMKGANFEDNHKSLARNLLITALILLIGTTAVSLQGGDTITFLTNGGPEYTTTTFHALILNQAFSVMRYGIASAIATPIFIVVAFLGILTSIITITTNLRLLHLPKETEPASIAKWLKIISIILMLITLLFVLVSVTPYGLRIVTLFRIPGDGFFAGIGDIISESNFWRFLLNTWYMPLLIVMVVQIPVTYIAALGIGALRPLGKASEWLLLLFAPWLFVRVLLVLPGISRTLFDFKIFNTLTGFALPYLVNIPVLFILTLFFRGQAHQATEKEKQPKFFKTFILPSIPLTLFCIVLSVMFIQQDLLWPMATNTMMLSTYFRRIRMTLGANIGSVGNLLWLLRILSFILSFIILAVFQIFYFPRLGIKIGKNK